MQNIRLLLSVTCWGIVSIAVGCESQDIDDILAPSTVTGAEVQAFLKPGMTSDDLHKQLQTTPVLTDKNCFHWELADGSIWTQFVPSKRGMLIVGWRIESDSANGTGGEIEELNRLFSHFYEKPDPAKVTRILKLAAEVRMFEEEHHRQSMAAFLSPIFRANPSQVAAWAQLPESTPAQRQVIYSAIAEAKLDQSEKLLRTMMIRDAENNVFIQQLLKAEPKDVLEREIDAPMDLDALWAGFFATGDRRYVERICTVFSWDVSGLDRSSNKWRINGAAAWSVESNARRHPIVAQVCHENARQADERAKPIYEKILAGLKRNEGSKQPN